MPNVMAALPNIVGALCITPQSLSDAHYSSAVSSEIRLVLGSKFWLVESCHVTSTPRPHAIQSPIGVTPT